jgi:cytochrome c oxidase cbb3-type subunit III
MLSSWLGFLSAANGAPPEPSPLPKTAPAAMHDETAQADPARIERGKAIMSVNCSFCHGAGGRGTGVAPDLMASSVLKQDPGNGANLGEFLKVGRPARGMPAFASLSAEQVSDLAGFLHGQYQLAQAAAPQLSILVGDRAKGEKYFAARCANCHAAQAMQGIGGRYDEKTLQARILNPRARGSGPAPRNFPEMVSVGSGSGQLSGELLSITDFFVTLRDAAGVEHTVLREGDTPLIERHDPLQAHMDLLRVMQDRDLHDLTAYLAGMK